MPRVPRRDLHLYAINAHIRTIPDFSGRAMLAISRAVCRSVQPSRARRHIGVARARPLRCDHRHRIFRPKEQHRQQMLGNSSGRVIEPVGTLLLEVIPMDVRARSQPKHAAINTQWFDLFEPLPAEGRHVRLQVREHSFPELAIGARTRHARFGWRA